MYWPVCQREARRVNALYEAIEKSDMKEKFKLIGIGANNSAFEIKHFKDTYQVPFPLFPDGDMAIHNALGGEVRTPYFMGLKIKGKAAPEIFFTHLGGFKKADAFLDTILKASGLK